MKTRLIGTICVTALLTLITGWIAPRHDLRALLIFGAGLMAATGLAFPGVEHFVLIALVAFIGTINPSGGDLGVLVPLEHAVLAKSATDDRRTEVFARYSLIGALCTAAGSLAATLPDFLVSRGSATLGIGCHAPAPSAHDRVLGETLMSKGPATAAVTIVEFSDYQ